MAESQRQPEWRLRTLETGDDRGVVELLERGFDRPFTEASWRWKVKRRTSPAPNVFLAVDGDEKPIFHYAGIHRRLELSDDSRDVMIAVDGVSDPDFRRRGLLTSGTRAAHERWSAAGVAYVLGLPNEQWGSRIEALDWRPLFPLRWRIRPLRPEFLLARKLRIPALGKLSLAGRLWNRLWHPSTPQDLQLLDIDEFGPEFDRFLGKHSESLALQRDRDWLRWRYLSCPDHDYRVVAAYRSRPEGAELAGYAVFRLGKEDRVGFIAEVVTVPASHPIRRALIAGVVERLGTLGASAVAALAAPTGDLHRSLVRGGFLFSWGEFMVHCVSLRPDLAEAVPKDPGLWRLQGGDFDVV